jgi:hypothetical protein
MSKEKPIIFSREMVKALLEGRKTQTRRLIKSQPHECHNGDLIYKDDLIGSSVEGRRVCQERNKSKYKVGDVLYVKEAWNWSNSKKEEAIYKADYNDPAKGKGFWKSPIYMPKELSRIHLEIINIRVERISEEDAKSEGITSTAVVIEFKVLNDLEMSKKQANNSVTHLVKEGV